MNLQEFFRDEGYDISIKTNNDKNVDLWDSWYKGNVKSFHTYWVYNRPGRKVRRKKRTLQMFKKVCEDWADLLMSDKVDIRLENEDDNEMLQKLINDLKLYVIINQGIEKAFALGTGALIFSIKGLNTNGEQLIVGENTEPFVEFVDAKKVIPLSWSNEDVTECAFINYKTEQGTKYIYISMHVLDKNNEYVIKNYKFRYDNKKMYASEDDNILEKFETHSKIPWFTCIKPNICNNYEDDSPFGISVCANSIATLMNIDDIYDCKDLEVMLGKRRTFVSEDLLTYDEGKEQYVFDPNDISVYVLPKNFNKDMLIQSDNDDLRTDKMINDLNNELDVLSSKVGFGQEHYSFNNRQIQTATEVISQNSDMYRTIKKHELLLEANLKQFFKALIQGCNMIKYNDYEFKSDEVIIDFDDSIIEDKGTELQRAQNNVSLGLLSKKTYLIDYLGYSEDEAIKELENIDNEKEKTITDIF